MSAVEESVCRTREMFSEKLDREGANLAMLEAQYEMGSAKVLKLFQQGRIVFPVHGVPEMARFLGVDPAWLMRIYLEDHLPATLATIDRTSASMLLTKNERDFVLACRRFADAPPSVSASIESRHHVVIGEGVGPPMSR